MDTAAVPIARMFFVTVCINLMQSDISVVETLRFSDKDEQTLQSAASNQVHAVI